MRIDLSKLEAGDSVRLKSGFIGLCVEIIKNPKWSSDDMKAAYAGLGETSMNFDSWLEQYKENRNG
jgi:hypothetical protein